MFKSKKINILKKKSFETLIIDTENGVKVNSKYGSWFATRVTPKRTKNDKFKNDSIISIWFTEDEKRHPIKFWVKMKYGGLLLELYESE